MNPTITQACCSERGPRLWYREEKLGPSPAVSLNLGEEAESWNTKVPRFHRTMHMRGDNSTEKNNIWRSIKISTQWTLINACM